MPRKSSMTSRQLSEESEVEHSESHNGSEVEEVNDQEYDSDQLDRPRVAQWMDEEDLEEQSEEEPFEAESEASDELVSLKKDLSELPLGAILKARKALKKGEPDSSEEDNDSSDEEDEDEAEKPQYEASKEPKERKERKEIEHRSNKHAPTTMTSKKPVTRRRQVVEVQKIKARDPRFSDLSGSLSVEKFQTQYGFLKDMHKNELSELKQNLTRARKLLVNSPQNLREERTREVERLERATKRTESIVNREKREAAEYAALQKIEKEEKEKRKAGKNGFWLKDCE
ncbi:hypothetical protein M422DRAFT_76580 [Sphaerobolus stellatus SS14]|uniref:rRNA biogenesis protein RRP36 n=1 Tax=Sphaerobolus stellatus (strain SS14) TaxID=990650 RepID=A0A0C9UBM8_SPHS4|nr:hypothetical protein M422DRAFT_76580 [Sphaerobolus stellatus SS14]